MTEKEIVDETIYAPRGSLILSGDSYIIENEGWYQIVSPSRPDPSRNEVIFSELEVHKAEDKIIEVIEFYKILGTSFKWCTNPTTKPSTMPSLLKKYGFKSWFSRGMYCEPAKIEISCGESVDVEKVSSDNLSLYLDLFIEGWGIDPKLRVLLKEDYNWALSQPNERFNYFIVKNKDEPVGTAGFVNKGKSAYLIGGNILSQFRNKGYYKALVKRRLEIIEGLGIPIATTGARDHTSAPILEKLGFITVYKSEIFQYQI